MNSEQVIRNDLDLIVDNLTRELPALSGRTLLIAGGAGFLGYYLVQAALHWNKLNCGTPPIKVIVLDNFIRGIPDWLTELKSRDGDHLRLVQHDITRPLPNDLGTLHYLIYAASIASPIYYRQYPIETMDANVNGLWHILNYSLAQKRAGEPVGGVLFYSSSEIYGDPTPENIPTPETYRGNVSCTGPRACYDQSKRFGETLCVNFAQQHGIPVKIARPFNNFGPGLKISDRRVIADFARDILAERDVIMLSDGSARRTFCYVADAVTCYYKILVNGRPGEAYNVGVETPEISMADLARTMASLAGELFNYRGSVIHRISDDKDYLVDNPNRRCPIILKARTELDYDPRVSLEDGLRRALIWYSANRSAADA